MDFEEDWMWWNLPFWNAIEDNNQWENPFKFVPFVWNILSIVLFFLNKLICIQHLSSFLIQFNNQGKLMTQSS